MKVLYNHILCVIRLQILLAALCGAFGGFSLVFAFGYFAVTWIR